MTPAIFLFYAVGHLGLFAAAIALLVTRGQAATVPLVLVTAGLVYDNAMLAFGGTIGFGQQLEQLSVPRYFMHAVSTPLLVLTALGLLQRAGPKWSRAPLTWGFATLLVIAMIGVGFWSDMWRLALEPQSEAGLVSYGNANSVPIAPMVTIVVLIVAGVVLWRHGAGPVLLAAALLQFAAAALGEALVFAGNLGELLLLAGLVWTDWKLVPSSAPQAGSRAALPGAARPASGYR